MSRKAGFTLLEILLALMLVGVLFVALNTFIFSMGELWGRNSDLRLFDQHVNAVTRFINDTFQTAAFPPSARANALPINPVQITPLNGTPDNLITFDLPAGSRILNWIDHPLPEVVCSLQARPNDGLYLLWHSRLEVSFATDPPRETQLTPFVTALQYDYFDPNAKTWSTVSTLNMDVNNQPLMPQRLRLLFTYGKLSRVTTVMIPEVMMPNAADPVTPQGLPNY
jgi:prepilin-type N-terminal cleavage/methylation domain-containing protein